MNDEREENSPYAAPELARAFEQSQIGKFHTKGGTGFAAEDANTFADRIRLRDVEITGTSNETNGADRIVDNVPIQTKYFSSPAETVAAAFDSGTGQYRYQTQVLEVPRDQYDECVRIMEEKIRQGKVPGFVDPKDAERLVSKGDVTYRQARNIARAGNIDSLLFDVKTQSITTAYVFAVSFAVYFAQRKWRGETTDDAIAGALQSAIVTGGTTLATGVIAAQVLRTRAAAMGVVAARSGVKALGSTAIGRQAVERLAHASLGKAVYGAAAINHVAKLLRSNVITSTIATVVISTPDFCRAAVSNSISWAQFGKNFAVNAGGVAGGVGGWMGGAAAGAAAGSFFPVVGTAVGAAVGGIIGAFGGGWLGTTTVKGVMDALVEDDAQRMIALLQVALEELAMDFLLSEQEVDALGESVRAAVDGQWLRSMYQAGCGNGHDAERQIFAYDAFEEACLVIARKRRPISLPPPEVVTGHIDKLAASLPMNADIDALIADITPWPSD